MSTSSHRTRLPPSLVFVDVGRRLSVTGNFSLFLSHVRCSCDSICLCLFGQIQYCSLFARTLAFLVFFGGILFTSSSVSQSPVASPNHTRTRRRPATTCRAELSPPLTNAPPPAQRQKASLPPSLSSSLCFLFLSLFFAVRFAWSLTCSLEMHEHELARQKP